MVMYSASVERASGFRAGAGCSRVKTSALVQSVCRCRLLLVRWQHERNVSDAKHWQIRLKIYIFRQIHIDFCLIQSSLVPEKRK